MDENVEDEEREDEFDIVSFFHYFITCDLTLNYHFYLKGRRAGAATKKNESRRGGCGY